MRLLKLVPDNTNIGFVKARWIAFSITILLTIASIALIATRGLNLGVDFVGGLMVETEFQQPVSLDTLPEKGSAVVMLVRGDAKTDDLAKVDGVQQRGLALHRNAR